MLMKDIPFTPNVPPDVYEKAKNWLVTKKASFTRNANFCIFNQKGDEDARIGTACHSGIIGPSHKDRCIVATEIGLTRNHGLVYPTKSGANEKTPDKEPFLKWFAQESPYSRFILNRNDFDFIKEFGIIVSADVCTPILQNIMIISRHFHEIPDRSFNKFNELVASGVDAKIAYPLCFNTGWSTIGPDNCAVVSYSGHRAHPLFNLKAWANWMAGEIGSEFKRDASDPKNYYRNMADYNGGTYLFHDKTDNNPDTYAYDGGQKHFLYQLVTQEPFREALSSYRKSTQAEGVYRPPNPFAPKTANISLKANQLTYTELWDFALPWCIKNGVFDAPVELTKKEVVNG